MKRIQRTDLMTAGLRGLACAGVATLITALVSWSFVASAGNLDWLADRASDAGSIHAGGGPAQQLNN